jgi:hypothetical protein
MRDAAYLYELQPKNDKRLTSDYEAAEDNVSMLNSERDELRDRMKAWLRFRELEEWKDFRFSAPYERWKVDVRALRSVLRTNKSIQIPFPERIRLAFAESDIETLISAGRSRKVAVLRWLPRASSVGLDAHSVDLDAQQSRDWDEPESDEAD